MNLLVDLWVAVNLFSVTVTILIMTRTAFRVIPLLKKRGSWQYETVRNVVAAYQRRDFYRLVRVSLYLMAGLASFFTKPAHQPEHLAAILSGVVAGALVLGVLNECWDAISDYRYRNAWLSPL